MSCGIARETLPGYGYRREDIGKICGMIMATQIPQSPANHLENILADADLDYLGRDDFFTIGDTLFEELKQIGILLTERDWNQLQVRFLEAHRYFTDYSIANRKPQKNIYLNNLKKSLEND